jgi:hypothetical protein
VLSIIVSYSLYNIFIENKNNFVLKGVFYLIITGFITSNIFIYYFLQDKMQIFRTVFGVISREEYLTNVLKNSPYQVFKFINSNLSKDDKIFFIGEQRGFYCNKNFITTNIFVPDFFVGLINSSENYNELVNKLKKMGITYVLYNKNESERLKGYGILNFSSKGDLVWKEFLNNIDSVYNFNDVYLYKLP